MAQLLALCADAGVCPPVGAWAAALTADAAEEAVALGSLCSVASEPETLAAEVPSIDVVRKQSGKLDSHADHRAGQL